MKSKSLTPILLAGALALGLLQLNQAKATTQYFQFGGGANNTWDTTSLDWASASGGPYGSAWLNGNDAVFEAAGGAVPVAAGGVTVGSMTFNVNGVTIQNNTVTLTGTPTITVNSAATISSILADGGLGIGFTKAGSATLTLNNAGNSYSGGTTISAGALDIAYKASLGTGLVTLSGGSLQSTTVAAGPLNLTNSFAFFNGGTLNYDNTSTSSGTLHIGTGVGATVNIGTSGGTINAGRGGNTDFRGEVYVDGQLTGSGPLTNGWSSGSGTTAYTHLMNNNNSYNGTVTVKGTSGKSVYLNLVATNALQYGTVNFNLNGGSVVGLHLETANATTTIAGLTGTTGTTVQPNQAGGASPAGTYTLNVNNSTDNTFGGTLANSSGTSAILALQKSGSGALTLSGANTYSGGTTVSAGTLLVTNSTGSATGTNTVTVNANGTLGGSGIIGGAVTVAAQGTLAAGSVVTPGRLTINNSVTLQSGSTNAMRINKSGAVLTSDQIAGTSSLALNGALVVTATGDALAQGDTFTLFAKGSYSGFFVASNLPALTAPLAWDISKLTNNGTIRVYNLNVVLTPLFSPVAGGYASPQSVTLSSDAGVTIHYTTNAWAMTNVYSSPIVLPPNTTGFTISAYGTQVGFSDSAVGTATYSTTPTPTWEQLTGGSWQTAANWSNNVIANASGVTADLSTLTLTGNNTLTVDGATTVGQILFADQGAAYNWILSGSGPLTVDAGTNVPVINVSNLMTTISTPVTGTNGLVKNGAGTLVFSAQKTYTGGTTINAGILNLTGGGGGSGVIRGTATVNTGGTLQLSTQDAVGYNGGASALTNINLVGGTLNVNTTANQTLGNALVNLTGGVIAMTSGSGNLDFYSGSSALNTLASTNSSTISGITLNLRQGSTTFTVAQGATASGIDLDISSVIKDTYNNGAAKIFTKAGLGTMRLAGANTYGESTAVSNGTLIVTGTLGTGAVTVSTNATLSGTGTIGGATTIQPGGRLNLDTVGLGTLTINNTLTLAGNVTFRVSKDSGAASDQIVGLTTVTYGGALIVTNITTDTNANPLALGDTFTLFNASTHAGNFSSYVLPVLPAGLNWDVSDLQSSGSIAVVNTAAMPVFNLPAGNYAGAQSVTISTLTPGATIYYTTDGSTPTASSPVYTTPVVVPAGTNLTIQAYVTAAGLGDSPVASATYLTIATPTWSNPAGGSWPDSGSWLAGIVANGSGVTADISTLTLSANTTITLDSKPTVGQILFADQGNAFGWILTNGTGGPLTLNAGTNVPDINVSNQTATITATLVGTNGFAKTGAGTLALAGNVVNTYTGTTTVSNGTLIVDNNNSGNSSSLPNNASGFAISGTSTLTVKSTAGVGGRNSMYGKPITFDATGGGTLSVQSGNQEWCGTMTTSGGARDHFTGTNINMNTGAGTVTFNITRGTDAVSDLDVAVALVNDIAGSGGLVKTGNGILTLAKTNSYTHATTVSNGTLIVNGSLAAGGVTVNAGATLAGTGTIGGATALQSGAQLTPGTASPGTLTFTNTLTLAAGSTTTLRINNAGASDQVSGMTSVTFGGTLTVNNVGGTLALGNTFQLFSATSYGGNFATTNLPALGTGLAWHWNPTAGTLAVVSPVNTTPTNLTATVAGNVLTLSWPADHTGWRLLVQTNSLAAGISSKTNDWETVSGSAGINSTNITVDATKPGEYYRLVYP